MTSNTSNSRKIVAEMAARHSARAQSKLVEGPIDTLHGLVGAAKNWRSPKLGYQSSQAQYKGAAILKPVIDAKFNQWNQKLGQLRAAATATGGQLDQDTLGTEFKNFVTAQFPNARNIDFSKITNAADPKTAYSYITAAANQNSGTTNPPSTQKPAVPVSPTQSPTTTKSTSVEPIKIGGQTLNPNDPADAKLIKTITAKTQTQPQAPKPAMTSADFITAFNSLPPNEQELVRSRIAPSKPSLGPTVQTSGRINSKPSIAETKRSRKL